MNTPSPFSPETTMIVTDHDTNIYIEYSYYQSKQKETPKLKLLLTRIGPSPGPSSPPSFFLS